MCQGFDFILPFIRCNNRTTGLTVIRVIYWVVAISAVNNSGKVPRAVGGVFNSFGWILIRKGKTGVI